MATMLNLLASPIIPTANELVVVVVSSGNEACAAVSLDDASVHVFSLIDGSYKLGLKDPCGCIAWGLAVIGSGVVAGSTDWGLRV